MPLKLSITQARRLALSAQGFGKQPGSAPTLPALKRMLQRLGVVQIDSVNAVVRSHYLPLFSRLGNYPVELLDQLAWGRGRQRQLFEYWGTKPRYCRLTSTPCCAGAWPMPPMAGASTASSRGSVANART